MVKYEEKGFDDIVMGDFNVRIGLGAEEHPNRKGKRLLELVGWEMLAQGISCSAVMVGGLGKIV